MELTDTQKLVAALYKDEQGDPIRLTKNQDRIFAAITKKLWHRVQIMCHTRFGKSLTVALAVLTRVTYYPEKWAIIAPTEKKAKIIMNYIISHIFDNQVSARRFVKGEGEKEEDIMRYRNKNHITFRIGKHPVTEKVLMGEIFIGNAKDALGFGAANVVEDESALIEDEDQEMVMRMLGDNPFDNYLYKIGNPFQRNHFLKTHRDPKYHKIIIDCYQSLQEGRMSQELIDENIGNKSFPVLYKCMFPSQNDMDETGWQLLFNDNDIKLAMSRTLTPSGKRRMGIDVARGGRNYTVWVMRTDNYAKILCKNRSADLIGSDDSVGHAETTLRLMKENGIQPCDIFIDDNGVGGGLTDYLKHMGIIINPVMLGSSEVQDISCANVRSDVYAGKYGVYSWLTGGAKLEESEDWYELTSIRHKKNMSSKTLIMSKDDMLKKGIESPDVADALALTFAFGRNYAYSNSSNNVRVNSGVKPFFPGIPG